MVGEVVFWVCWLESGIKLNRILEYTVHLFGAQSWPYQDEASCRSQNLARYEAGHTSIFSPSPRLCTNLVPLRDRAKSTERSVNL